MEAILNKLEYNEIIDVLEKHCKTYLGKNMCDSLKPSFSFELVDVLLNETKEADTLLHQKGSPPFYETDELEKYIKILKSNQTLSIKGLLNIGMLLRIARELKEYFYDNNTSSFINLEKYFTLLYSNPSIEKSIFDKIIDESTIADNASKKLSSLRRNRKNFEQEVKDKLNSYIHSSTYAKYIMEPIVTIRNNRYVIPVKEEYRSYIKGFVHDTSSSGSTLYIEPTSIFDLNNKINHIKIEEDLEIEKILHQLSASLYAYTTELDNDLNLIANIDLIFAKAHFGIEINGITPILNNEKFVDLHKARHPLIDKDKVVPINIGLGKDYVSLLITGPNTGGKTVALKTLGLLLLMAYSGIPIPCSEGSNICVFTYIFADIGDEQSIQESLSTFSAHMKNIVEITKKANDNSLVLLDELGSGTDPVEGAALAISILSYLKSINALVCCTTHYQELKEFALVTDGFENASFEFDIENLKPTYKLLVGIPGKSNAFAISKKLGLDEQILNVANAHLKEDKVSIEELLKNIYDNKLKVEKQVEETEKNLRQVEALRKSLEKKQDDVLEKRAKMLKDAKLEARDILLSAKEEATEIIHELSASVDLKQANNIRNKLNDKIRNINSVHYSGQDNSFEVINKNDIKDGLNVYISSLGTNGIILGNTVNKSNEVQVQVGSMKMNVKLSDLRKLSSNVSTTSKSTGKVTTEKSSKTKVISPEINVIGQNVDEAIYVIDKYLDNCASANISPVRIVHGKGTGKLREGIHSFLKKHPHVKSFRIGTFGEGEMGVTVVEIK
ncbi:MAG: endonuclease MutS2 [Clostridia bacterium]|nr:endonuclease MutS2 [Clostridia bacterium]